MPNLDNTTSISQPLTGRDILSGKAQPAEEGTIAISSKGLRIFRWGWTIFMVLATSFPYFLNFASAPRGYRYTWIVPPYPEDSLSYIAWSQQAAHGALLFKIKYTALPQSALLFQPFFLICGWASRLFACNIGVIHFLAKEVGVVLFFLVFCKYVDYLGLTAFRSMVASVLAGISSGLAGPMALLGWRHDWPMVSADMRMPEVSTYWPLLWNPLFPYSLALILLTVYYLDRGTRDKRKTDLWLAGLSSGVLALLHPYSQPVLLALALIMIAVRRRTEWLPYLLRYLAILTPFVLYVLLLSILQPVFAQHSSSGAMSSPAIQWYLLGFGVPLLIWIAGWSIDWGRWMKQYWQVVAWFVLCLGLAYFPCWFQRKLIFGAHIPLCILAAISFDLILAKHSSARTRKWVLSAAMAVLVPILVVTPIYLLVKQNRDARSNMEDAYYISSGMDEGLNFLKQHSKPDQIVLAGLTTSILIPAFSGNTVLWGHWAMSVDLNARRDWFNQLDLQSWGDEARAKKFWDSGIEYIFADGNFRMAIKRDPWKWWGILKDTDEVFHNDTVVIYKRRIGS